MTPIQLSGKPAEVLKQFESLSLPEDAEICLTVAEMTPEMKAKQENAEMMRRMEEKYADFPRVNGRLEIALPELTTLEQVQEALYRSEMEDDLGENWEEVLKQMQDAHEANAQSCKQIESAVA